MAALPLQRSPPRAYRFAPNGAVRSRLPARRRRGRLVRRPDLPDRLERSAREGGNGCGCWRRWRGWRVRARRRPAEQHRCVDRLARTVRCSGAHPPGRCQRRHVAKEPLVIGGGTMAIDEPHRLIVSVSQGVPVTGSRCGALSRTIGTPSAVELDVKSALDDLKTVFNIVVHVHRGAGLVGTEPGICLEDFTIGVLAVAHDVPVHVLARAKVDAPHRGRAVYRVKRSSIHRGSIWVVGLVIHLG